jgi:hypothetical protein
LVGFVQAAELPSEALIPTALEPAAVITLTAVLESVQIDLNREEPAFAPQANLPIVSPFPGFRPSGDVEKSLFDLNLVALVGLNIADYVSTREALKYPGLREANPFMQPFVKNPAVFAAVKIGTTALTYLGMKALFKRNRIMAWVLTMASNFLMSYVVASNLQRIQQARAF